MIDRYRREEMYNLFTDQAKFQAYLDVEIATLEAWVELGFIPKDDVVLIREKAKFSVERIREIELETRHDIVAFTRAVSESLGEEKKWVHYGLTSTDVVDTAHSYLYKQANDIIHNDLIKMSEILKQKALQYQNVPCIGRTHGIHADITSFGLKWALWYDEWNRQIKRFEEARKELEVGKISGAVGNFANTPPFVQDYVCEQLGIQSSNISTQTLQRDRHAHFMSTLALIAGTLEKIALEIRHLQRTEVREVEEAFRKGQKGSSAMPHKRNPIASENITGIARIIRGYMLSTFENIPLWHERDISHSSVERVVFPDAFMALDYAINRYSKVLDNLVVYEDRMMENIFTTHGVIFSQRILSMLIEKGLSRELAYDMIQPIAMKAWNEKIDYKPLLLTSEVMNHLTEKELEEAFNIDYFLRHVTTIYKRVGIL